ncbi:hypothetical protein [Mycobacterium riyadhense]|uniref:hypothetical protein n=1 Tax=Mycobacterium riyadhense TaxID=486698 RepID=UPI00195927DA|nr:hypothetical protein [Mycobacterium riyadhense]
MNTTERVLATAWEMWGRTRRPVSAEDIARTLGLDRETTQQALEALRIRAVFGDVGYGDDRIDEVSFAD